MTLAQLHKRALLGAAALGPLGVISGSIVLLAGGLATLAVLIYSSRDLHAFERSSTRRAFVHSATGLLLALTLLSYKQVGIDAVFIVLLLGVVNRVLLRAGHRDDFLIIGASAVLVSAATVVTSGVSFALLLLIFVPLVAVALWTSLILGGGERDPHERRVLLERAAPSGGKRLAFSALVLMLAASAFVAVLPRYKFVSFLAPGAFASLPGASDRMNLDIGGLSDFDDETVVLRATLAGKTTRADLDGVYARLYALDQLEGNAWSALTGGHYARSDSNEIPPDGKVVDLSLVRLVRGSVHHPIAVLGREKPWAVRARGVPSPAIHFDVGSTAVVDSLSARAFEYSAVLDEPLGFPLASPLGDRAAELGRSVPDDLDPRVRALADSLTAGKEGEHEKIDSILKHFARGFEYSLEPLDGESGDPLVRFLFESRHGHCELYAGAVATLLRVAGLRARVITGYYNGRWNDFGDYLVFAQGDAHAWVEVLTSDQGWIWVDATPASERVRRKKSAFTWIRDSYDALNALWFDNVVDFDARRQQRFYAKISQRFDDLSEGFEGLDWGAFRDRGSSALSGLLLLALIPAALGGAVIALRRRRNPAWLGRRLRRALGQKTAENVRLETLVSQAANPELARAAVDAYERFRFDPAGSRDARSVRSAISQLERG